MVCFFGATANNILTFTFVYTLHTTSTYVQTKTWLVSVQYNAFCRLRSADRAGRPVYSSTQSTSSFITCPPVGEYVMYTYISTAHGNQALVFS